MSETKVPRLEDLGQPERRWAEEAYAHLEERVSSLDAPPAGHQEVRWTNKQIWLNALGLPHIAADKAFDAERARVATMRGHWLNVGGGWLVSVWNRLPQVVHKKVETEASAENPEDTPHAAHHE